MKAERSWKWPGSDLGAAKKEAAKARKKRWMRRQIVKRGARIAVQGYTFICSSHSVVEECR